MQSLESGKAINQGRQTLAWSILFGIAGFSVACAYLLATSLAIAGSHLIDLMKGIDSFHLISKCSFLLFPDDVNCVSNIVDLFYLFALSIFILVCFCIGCFFALSTFETSDSNRFSFEAMTVALVQIPVFAAVLHFCGNIHYHFYCAVGVIETEHNCRWMYNGYTLLVGPAGLVLLIPPLTAIVIIVAGSIRYGHKWKELQVNLKQQGE